MKRKRIQYNELNEEIYAPKYWTKFRLIVIGLFLLTFGFLVNFSIEEKLNKYLQNTLSNNNACPIQFDKVELSYLLPKVTMKKPVILGACFGQYNNRLEFKDIKIAFHSPSFYPVGIRLHMEASSGKSYINLFPVISIFSQNIKIEKTIIDTQILAPMMANNTAPLSGLMSIEGFFEFKSGAIHDGEIAIVSNNFSIPAQNINNFDVAKISLETLNIQAHFSDQTTIVVDRFQLGKSTAPVDINLKGQINVKENNFLGSILVLDGSLKLTPYMMTNFPILNLYLPSNITSGTYKMKINGPLRNPGAPQIL